MVKTYDQACLDLALTFLKDSNVHDDDISNFSDLLAKDIQQAIEDFLEEKHIA